MELTINKALNELIYCDRAKIDITIIGAGVSGLILANEITERTSKKVLLLEKKNLNLIKTFVIGAFLEIH